MDNIADPILVHPEIRKNLMLMKSVNDGIRGLMLKAGNAFDLIDSDQSKDEVRSSENLIALLTPILNLLQLIRLLRSQIMLYNWWTRLYN